MQVDVCYQKRVKRGSKTHIYINIGPIHLTVHTPKLYTFLVGDTYWPLLATGTGRVAHTGYLHILHNKHILDMDHNPVVPLIQCVLSSFQTKCHPFLTPIPLHPTQDTKTQVCQFHHITGTNHHPRTFHSSESLRHRNSTALKVYFYGGFFGRKILPSKRYGMFGKAK